MHKVLLLAVMVMPVITGSISAQTVVTEMDKVTYYNSLDTNVSAVYNKIAWLCNCYMQKNYPKTTVTIKLDMELSRDTMYYEIGFDNLYGNAGFADTTGTGPGPADNVYFDTGLRIKACDTAINKENILKLIDYGIRYYEQLKNMRAEMLAMLPGARPQHCSIDKGSMEAILAKRTSLKIKEAIRYCR